MRILTPELLQELAAINSQEEPVKFIGIPLRRHQGVMVVVSDREHPTYESLRQAAAQEINGQATVYGQIFPVSWGPHHVFLSEISRIVDSPATQAHPQQTTDYIHRLGRRAGVTIARGIADLPPVQRYRRP